MGAGVIGRVPLKRNRCRLAVCLSRIWATRDWGCIAARRAAGSYPTRPRPSQNNVSDGGGQTVAVGSFASATGGTDQRTDVVRVADAHRCLMSLLIIRVPE